MSHRHRNRPSNLSKRARLAHSYERLVRLRQIEHRTIRECAELLQVSPRTVDTYLAAEAYHETVERFRSQMREAAITNVADASEKAIKTLVELMDYARSGHVRFEAAAKILDLVGVQRREEDTTGLDDSAEYERLLAMLAARPTTVNVFRQPVEPGGFLPKALRPDPSGNADDLPGRMLKRLSSERDEA